MMGEEERKGKIVRARIFDLRVGLLPEISMGQAFQGPIEFDVVLFVLLFGLYTYVMFFGR